MSKFDTGIFVSQHGKNVVEESWNVDLKNAVVINNPLEIKQILKLAEEPVEEKFHHIDFVSVGRLFPQKGFKNLLEAHHQLILLGYNIKTLIIGDGMQRAELEALIRKYNLAETFFLYGFSNNPIKYIQNSRCFVLPSYSESYPMVIGEALCLNKPVLSTNVGGVPEMVHHNVNGLLFEPGEKNLLQAMKAVLDDPSLQKRFSQHDSLAELKEKNNRIFHHINQLFN